MVNSLDLRRDQYRAVGIFGVLTNPDDPSLLLMTLEHAFGSNGKWFPVIPDGVYTCLRGMHQLKHMTESFETFQITQVTGHTGLLFHPGNTNRDTVGCVCLGQTRTLTAIERSDKAFAQFMGALTGVNQFILRVSRKA